VDIRIIRKQITTEKADAFDAAEGSSLMNAIRARDPKKRTRLADKTPPESETSSCIHRGNLKTWESQMLPYK
jgi:hypothetical protein